MSGLLQRISGMRDIISFFSRIKSGDISRFMALIAKAQDESLDLRARVVAVVDLADLLTDYTESTTDDQIVDFVKSLTGEDAIWKLVSIVQDLMDGGVVSVGAMEGEGLIYAQASEGQPAKMIPWHLVIQLAQLVVMFLKSK